MQKEKVSIQRNLRQMEELQTVEMRLLDGVQKATLYQQEVQQRYDEVVLAKTGSKPKLSAQHHVWLRAAGTASGAAWAGGEGPYEGPMLFHPRGRLGAGGRPATQSAYGGRIKG